MKKRSLLIVVALLCMASLMAAMAYSSATLENGAEIRIVDTDDALLALVPYVGEGEPTDLDDVAKIREEDGSLYFNFNKGLNNEEFGIQNGSTYHWRDLFYVKNNSENTIRFKVSATNLGTMDEGRNWLDIGIMPKPYNQAELFVADGVNVDHYVELESGESLPISVRMQLSFSTHARAVTGMFSDGQIRIEAHKVVD